MDTMTAASVDTTAANALTAAAETVIDSDGFRIQRLSGPAMMLAQNEPPADVWQSRK